MIRIHILFITTGSININSSNNIRNLALIKGLIENKHKIDILTVKIDSISVNYDDDSIDNIISQCKVIEIQNSKMQDAVSEIGIKESTHYGFFSKVRQSLKKMYYKIDVYDSLRYAIKNYHSFDVETSYDIVISSSDPRSSHLLAEKYFKSICEKSIRWIQYWGDPMYYDVTREVFCKRRLYNEEKRILAQADEIVYTNPLVVKLQKQLYPEFHDKIRFVPTSFLSVNNSVTGVDSLNSLVTVGYFGSYWSNARDIMPLYESASKYGFRLIIAGNSDVALEPKENIEILSRISINKLAELEKTVDMLVCLNNNPVINQMGDDLCVQIPGKAYHYALTNKPILMISENKDIVDYFKIYNRYNFSPNNAESIYSEISKIVNEQEKYLHQPVQEFMPQNVASLFLN